MNTRRLFPWLVFLVLCLPPACGDDESSTAGDTSALDGVSGDTSGGDTALADTRPSDGTQAGHDTATEDVPDAGDLTADTEGGADAAQDTQDAAGADTTQDTTTPSCTPAGEACGTFGACCSGNVCVDGLCRGCVRKGGFCTWGEADRCCSGSCDGDSCNGFPVGHECSANGDCQLGRCVGGVCACALGDAPCGAGGACVDIEWNDQNCGACGNVCGLDEKCEQSRCVCDPNQFWLTDCGDACVDLRIEEAHCGACGNACRADQVCRSSSCACASGTECDGACRFFGTDPANCGSCGNVCPADHPVCSAGQCVCPTGLTQCPTGCQDLQNDRTHCGACGNTCNGNRQCVAGSCR